MPPHTMSGYAVQNFRWRVRQLALGTDDALVYTVTGLHEKS